MPQDELETKLIRVKLDTYDSLTQLKSGNKSYDDVINELLLRKKK
jgi:predicted CopG family antitoxin